jgi:ankyrin repeat protein
MLEHLGFGPETQENLDLVLLLLYSGALTDINRQNNNGNTPLFIACDASRIRTVQILLDNDALSNIMNIEGETPLFEACNNNNIQLVEILLKHGAVESINIETRRNETPLLISFYLGYFDIFKLLLKYGALNIDNIVHVINSIDTEERYTFFRKHNFLLFYIFYNYKNYEEIPELIKEIIESLNICMIKIEELFTIKEQQLAEILRMKRQPMLTFLNSSKSQPINNKIDRFIKTSNKARALWKISISSFIGPDKYDYSFPIRILYNHVSRQ